MVICGGQVIILMVVVVLCVVCVYYVEIIVFIVSKFVGSGMCVNIDEFMEIIF